MRPILFLPMLGLALLAGCNNKIDFGPDEGYEGRDNSNYPVGPDDTTDWTSDEKWNKKELALFDELELELNGPQAGGVRRLALYPNPVETRAVFSFDRASNMQVQFKIVDRKYRVMLEHDAPMQTGSIGFSFNTTAAKLKKGEIYRLYYVFYNGSTLHYKGHGDIKIAN